MPGRSPCALEGTWCSMTLGYQLDKIDRKEEGAALCAAYEVEDLKAHLLRVLVSCFRFWVFYRAKQDGPVVLGWRHPWEGHEDHADDHGHGHE
ncbi:hypothetical protein C3L33_09424, partial [Rhododendron williamsianum]